jgi:hypothetical protein
MKLLFLNLYSKRRATAVGGGHVRSLIETALALKLSGHEVSFYNVAARLPAHFCEQLTQAGITIGQAPSAPLNLTRWMRNIREEIVRLEPHAVVTFDSKMHGIAVLATSGLAELCFISTKCGGPNPSRLTPDVKNQIVFSQENLNWFKINRPSANLLLLPNRVRLQPPDKDKTAVLSAFHSKPVLMRICRIDGVYDWTIRQGAVLSSALAKRGIAVDFVVIGAAKSEQHLSQVKAQAKSIFPNTHFYTNEFYTKRAAAFLPCAEYVLGTGRGFMEAAGNNKVMFLVNKGTDLPMFCDERTFPDALRTNFSGRASFGNVDVDEGVERFSNLVQDSLLRQQYQEWMGDMFRKFFDSSSIPARYSEFFSKCSPEERGFVQTLRRILSLIRALAYIYISKQIVGFNHRK